jgi:hypothetical protein
MASKLRSRLTFANVTAALALFLTLSGGTAIALSGTNSVNSADIKNGAVQTEDLADGAVSRSQLHKNAVVSSRVADNSLTGADINEATLDTSAKTLRYSADEAPGGDHRVASVGPYVLRASCTTTPTNGIASYLTAKGPAGHVTASYLEGDGAIEPVPHLRSSALTSGGLLVGSEADNNSPVDLVGGTIAIDSGSTVVTIVFASSTKYNGGSGHCSIHGTATLGT